jgi:hypothetical protein
LIVLPKTSSCIRDEGHDGQLSSSGTAVVENRHLRANVFAMGNATVHVAPKTKRQTFEEIEQLAWANRACCAVMKAESSEQGMED